MTRITRIFFCLLALLSGSASGSVPEHDAGLEPAFDALLEQGRLKVSARFAPDTNIVKSQKVELIIEIETDAWFAGGTRIGLFEVAGAMVLRRQSFATNFTRREQGETRAVQRWSILLYPLRSGTVSVPGIDVDLAVAGDNGETLKGRVQTQALSFEVGIPAGVQETAEWVATNTLSVSQRFDREFDSLQPGDALSRTIVIEAENLPALLLPKLQNVKIDGLAAYLQPPVLKDENQRGVVRSSRSQEIIYVVERPGIYEVPAQTIRWWDLASQSLQEHTLTSFTMLTEGLTVGTGNADVPERDAANFPIKTSIALVALVIFAIALVFYLRRRRVFSSSESPVQSVSELEREFAQHCRNNDRSQAISALYQLLDETSTTLRPQTLRERFSGSLSAEAVAAAEHVLREEYGPKMSSGETGQNLSDLPSQAHPIFHPHRRSSGRAKMGFELNG